MIPSCLQRPALCASLLAVALLGSSCSAVMSYIQGGPLVRDPDGPTGSIVVKNESDQTLTSILLADCGSPTYGLNRLPDGKRIEPGKSHEWTVSPGCWALLAGNGAAETREDIRVDSGKATTFTVN